MHHALKSRGTLEYCLFSVGVFGVNELWNDSTGLGKVIVIFWDLKDKGVGVTWEVGIADIVLDITLWVPLFFKERVKLVVLNINNDFFA